MANYQIYNDNESIKIVEANVTHSLDKGYSLFVMGNVVNIYFADKDSPTWSIDYRTVTIPEVTSAEALRTKLESWKTKPVEIGGATELNQYTQSDTFELILNELTEIKKLLKKIYQ